MIDYGTAQCRTSSPSKKEGGKSHQAEGSLPAPESAYSIACAIDEALKCKEAGESKTIAFNISGHGFMDVQGYREVLGLP